MPSNKGLQYGKAWLAIVGVIFMIIVTFLLVQFFVRPSASTEHRQTAPVVKQTVHPDALTQVLKHFGPWRIIDRPRSADILMLMQNGSVKQGSKTFRPDQSWQASFVPEFRDIVRDGNVLHIRSTSGAIYTIRAKQAFVLEARPETVYAFTHGKQIVAVPSATLTKKEK